MSNLDIKTLVAIWTISMTFGGWLTKRLHEAEGGTTFFVRILQSVQVFVALWVVALTVVIVAALVERADTDPVVGRVLLSTAGAIVFIATAWLIARSFRRRREAERAYLATADPFVHRDRVSCGNAEPSTPDGSAKHRKTVYPWR